MAGVVAGKPAPAHLALKISDFLVLLEDWARPIPVPDLVPATAQGRIPGCVWVAQPSPTATSLPTIWEAFPERGN